MSSDDWDESEDDETEDDFDESDDPDTVPCPNCRQPMYEDSPQCPYCGEYVTPSTSAWSERPWWWIALGLIGIVAVIGMLTALTR